MKISKKIPAFTLMEVTISMLVAGIAIAITFTAYRLVSRAYLDFSLKQQRISDLSTADKLLKQDFIQGKKILKAPEGISIVTMEGTIAYSFYPDYFLRRQYALRTDTFKIKTAGLSYLFEGEQVAEDERMDEFSLQEEIEGSLIDLRYYKLYSAQDLFP